MLSLAEKAFSGLPEEMSEVLGLVAVDEISYQDAAEEKTRELKQLASSSAYSERIQKDIDELAMALEREKKDAFERNRKDVARALEIEIKARVHGEEGRIKALVEGDTQIEVAKGVLRNPAAYRRLLGR